MRTPPPLPPAAVCALALWEGARAGGMAAVPAPGLWWLFERLGIADAFAHLLPVVAAGGIAVALTQPLAHVRHARPWAEGIAAALLVAAMLLPMPVAVLVASVPFALLSGVGGWAMLALAAVAIAPAGGIVATGMAIARLIVALRLPAAANDNQARSLPAG